jgi:hypothetical protein
MARLTDVDFAAARDTLEPYKTCHPEARFLREGSPVVLTTNMPSRGFSAQQIKLTSAGATLAATSVREIAGDPSRNRNASG